MDYEGYPEEKELNRIKKWNTVDDPFGLVKYVQERWVYRKWGFSFNSEDGALELHTGGWSGNEDLIIALEQNYMFWGSYWMKSERGGHYYFIVKKIV
jgi:hypothetical protein